MKKLFLSIALLLTTTIVLSQTLVKGTWTPFTAGQPESQGGTITWPMAYNDSVTTTYFYYEMKSLYAWGLTSLFSKASAADSTTTGIVVSNNLKTWFRYKNLADTINKTTSDTSAWEDNQGTAFRYWAVKKHNKGADHAILKQLILTTKPR